MQVGDTKRAFTRCSLKWLRLVSHDCSTCKTIAEDGTFILEIRILRHEGSVLTPQEQLVKRTHFLDRCPYPRLDAHGEARHLLDILIAGRAATSTSFNRKIIMKR